MYEKEQFDYIGNTPDFWFESAMDLVMASGEIGRASHETAKKMGFHHTRSFFPRLMLRAFALECLIKAHYLLAGNKLCSQGEYKGVVQKEGHDLRRLACHTDIKLSADEADMLERLSAVVVGIGRYPIFKKFNATRPAGWSEPQDEIVFHAFLARLVQPLDQKSLFATIIKDA